MTVYSQGLEEEKFKWNQVFNSVIFHRSQTLLYNETANPKPLCIARKVTNATNQQNPPNPIKIISLILITGMQKKSRSMTYCSLEVAQNAFTNIEKKRSNMGRLQFSDWNVTCSNNSIYVACD